MIIGRQFDKDGNLRDWWGDEIVARFEKEAQCIVDQYGQFTIAGTHVSSMLFLKYILNNITFIVSHYIYRNKTMPVTFLKLEK